MQNYCAGQLQPEWPSILLDFIRDTGNLKKKFFSPNKMFDHICEYITTLGDTRA